MVASAALVVNWPGALLIVFVGVVEGVEVDPHSPVEDVGLHPELIGHDRLGVVGRAVRGDVEAARLVAIGDVGIDQYVLHRIPLDAELVGGLGEVGFSPEGGVGDVRREGLAEVAPRDLAARLLVLGIAYAGGDAELRRDLIGAGGEGRAGRTIAGLFQQEVRQGDATGGRQAIQPHTPHDVGRLREIIGADDPGEAGVRPGSGAAGVGQGRDDQQPAARSVRHQPPA